MDGRKEGWLGGWMEGGRMKNFETGWKISVLAR